ncbi:hypothetical protein [Paraclostridium sordellii]|uniref:hypothetical protein n=1 Tax=Paraclostridium sordellii TaxID=1505 RepID=UPI000ABF515D|nr:hypothetical protein [Paeniclostridium sordellii]
MLEKICNGDKNFSPKIKRIKPKATQHCINQTFDKYRSYELEKILLKNKNKNLVKLIKNLDLVS